MLIWIALGALLGYSLTKATGSSYYRKLLTNLFVAGKIRKLALERKIDLDQEYKNFKSFSKRSRVRTLSLDQHIEEELQEELVGDDIELVEEKVKPKK